MKGASCDGKRVPGVTIFAWDDVLCPTTYAKHERAKRTVALFARAAAAGGGGGGGGAPRRPSVESKEEKELLKVGASVVRCVKAAQKHGPVVIVTELDERFVRATAELLLPAAASAFLKTVEVVSSKERFGKEFPGQPACWQIAAFSYITNRHLLGASAAMDESEAGRSEFAVAESRGGDVDRTREEADAKSTTAPGRPKQSANVGGGGDGAGERVEMTVRIKADGGHGENKCDDFADGNSGILVAISTASRAREDKSAMRTLRDHHPNIMSKTVALIQGPTPAELRKQLDLLSESFAWMFGHPRRESVASRSGSLPAMKTTATTTTTSKPRMSADETTTAADDQNHSPSSTTSTATPARTASSPTVALSPTAAPNTFLATLDRYNATSSTNYVRHGSGTHDGHSSQPRKLIERCDTGGNESDTRTNTTDTNTADSRSAEEAEFASWGEVGGGGASPFRVLSGVRGTSELTLLRAASGVSDVGDNGDERTPISSGSDDGDGEMKEGDGQEAESLGKSIAANLCWESGDGLDSKVVPAPVGW